MRSTRCRNKIVDFITPNSFKKWFYWKNQNFEISIWRFEAVRRDEVADFIAASCRSRSDLQYAAIKSATLSRRTASKTHFFVVEILKKFNKIFSKINFWSCSAWWSRRFYCRILKFSERSTRCSNKIVKFITVNSFKNSFRNRKNDKKSRKSL